MNQHPTQSNVQIGNANLVQNQQQHLQQLNTQQHVANVKTKAKSKKQINFQMIMSFIFQFLTVGMLGVLVFFSYYPPFLNQNNSNTTVLNEISKLAEINKDDPNIFIAQISDVNALRDENEIQSVVYKDAQNGDYALAVNDKVIVFRRSESRIIYNDKSPSAILQEQNLQLLNNIDASAKTVGIYPQESEQPQLLVVNDVELQKKSDPEFYQDVIKGDIIAVYPTSEKILIYRPDTQTIINSGSISTSINKE